MTFEEFLADAWEQHAEQPQHVADRLDASLGLIEHAEQIPRFAALVAHVYGEHLGKWERGCERLTKLKTLPALDQSAVVSAALERHCAALRMAAGEPHALDELAHDDRVAALALAAAALTGQQRYSDAINLYAQALHLAARGIERGSAAIRALAVGGNNLAAALEEQSTLDEPQIGGMIAAAEAALVYWKQCGGWLEEERAHYRLARTRLKAGHTRQALDHAQRCLQICERHSAPSFELFFAHALLAIAHRACNDMAAYQLERDRALQQRDRLEDNEREWCQSELQELDGTD